MKLTRQRLRRLILEAGTGGLGPDAEKAIKSEIESAFKRVGGNDLEAFQKALKSADFPKVINQNIRGNPIVGFEDPKVQRSFINAISDEHLKKMGLEAAATKRVSSAVTVGDQDPGKGIDALGDVLGDDDILKTLTTSPTVGDATRPKRKSQSRAPETQINERQLRKMIQRQIILSEGFFDNIDLNNVIDKLSYILPDSIISTLRNALDVYSIINPSGMDMGPADLDSIKRRLEIPDTVEAVPMNRPGTEDFDIDASIAGWDPELKASWDTWPTWKQNAYKAAITKLGSKDHTPMDFVKDVGSILLDKRNE